MVGAMLDRKEMPAYVRFETRAIEDIAASKAHGRYVAKDIDFVLITPPYSKDELIKETSVWLNDLDEHVRNMRMPEEWAEKYKRMYTAWKNGQEIPLDGTAIKGWPVISPAQQETLIRMQVMTVEMLAGMNDEGCRRYGMGALDLKQKATAWLSQAHDKGPLTMENAALRQQIAVLHGSVTALTAQMQAMAQQVRTGIFTPSGVGDPIPASAILPDEPEGRRGAGRPKKEG